MEVVCAWWPSRPSVFILPVGCEPKGGTQDFCAYLRTMATRHGRKSGGNGKRKVGKRSSLADHISTPKQCDAPVAGDKRISHATFPPAAGMVAGQDTHQRQIRN